MKHSTPVFYFVKPHPPDNILNRESPVPENYKYDWEPLVLKYLVWACKKRFQDIDTRIWHLISAEDDEKLLRDIRTTMPSAVFFTEIDILTNPVNLLAGKIKAIDAGIFIAVGGKQSSLLRKGDRMPFDYADFVTGGDGIEPVIAIIQSCLNNSLPGKNLFVQWDKQTGRVTSNASNPQNSTIVQLPASFRSLQVENHSFGEYIALHQKQPSLAPETARTSPVIIGTGCPHSCSFCQAPLEFGDNNSSYLMRPAKTVAEEILFLKNEWQVNNLFSLESNINFRHLAAVYEELENFGISHFPLSGFVRISDINTAWENGMLRTLAKKGMRFLHTGIDLVLNDDRDLYNKHNSYDEVIQCLKRCAECGIIIFATYIGNPESTVDSFRRQLDLLMTMPIADVDIRLAIALRNTDYYRSVEPNLLYHPDKDNRYFDVQNYRYQTIQFPGCITPEETYAGIKRFFDRFYSSPGHTAYTVEMMQKYPDTIDFFRAHYASKNIALPDRKPVQHTAQE
ncbi:MAG: radical SAM protein [Spirochaetales bacterium]|nr:radical SAM protein [Spirochaetales bacterium]